jgi:hypothetical protein
MSDLVNHPAGQAEAGCENSSALPANHGVSFAQLREEKKKIR